MYPSRTSGYEKKAVAEALEAKANCEYFVMPTKEASVFRFFTAFRMTKTISSSKNLSGRAKSRPRQIEHFSTSLEVTEEKTFKQEIIKQINPLNFSTFIKPETLN